MTSRKVGLPLFAKASERRVFRYAYEHRRVSKQLVARDLEMSLPTVSHALSALAEEGLVARGGTFPSTGGRPAVIYELCADARYAIGIELVAEGVHVAFVDLMGTMLRQGTLAVPFARTESYLQSVAAYLEAELLESGLPRERLLGVTIAIQGIVSQDASITFGGLLGNESTGIALEDFARHLHFPLMLAHDVEAAAYAEIWRHRELRNFAYLSLNDHLGSALVRDGKLVHSDGFGAGVAEHMVAVPQGAPCYCGNRGCFETLLGAKALGRRAGTTVPRFFEKLRGRDPDAVWLWDRYLDYLALLIHNLRMIACGDVVIGGRLSCYLTQGDLRMLRTKVSSNGKLSSRDFHLLCGHYRDAATALGAGIVVIDRYLETWGQAE